MAQVFSHSEKGLDINGNNVTINHYVNSNPQVVGMIHLPEVNDEAYAAHVSSLPEVGELSYLWYQLP